jgi:hypothetical protein
MGRPLFKDYLGEFLESKAGCYIENQLKQLETLTKGWHTYLLTFAKAPQFIRSRVLKRVEINRLGEISRQSGRKEDL